MKKQFFRCGMRELLALVALIGVLLALIAPRYRRVSQERRIRVANLQLLQAVAAGGQRAVDEALAAGADVRDPFLAMVVLSAVERNDVAIARTLLEAGADPNDPSAGQLLAKCLANDSEEMLHLLLKHGADPKRARLTPLIFSNAPPERKLRLVQVLKTRGVVIRPEELSTAMDQALTSSNAATCDLLLELGAPYTARETAALGRLEDLKRMVRENPAVLHEEFAPFWQG